MIDVLLSYLYCIFISFYIVFSFQCIFYRDLDYMLFLFFFFFFFYCYGDHRDLHVLTHSFPPRRSSELQAYGFVAAAGALTLVPMILITESRAGIVIGAVCLVAAAAIYRRPEQGIRTRGAKQVRGLAAAGLAIAGTIVVMQLSLTSRPTTIDRLTSESVADDLRFSALPYIWQMGLDAFPFGWGAGSFVTAYKVVEPDHLLSQNYLNHATNDLDRKSVV